MNIFIYKDYAHLLNKIGKHELFLHAGSLAYSIVLAMIPFLVVTVASISFLNISSQQALVEFFNSLFGGRVGHAVNVIVINANKEVHFAGTSGAISFVVLLISASTIFLQMRFALDKIDEHQSAHNTSGFFGFLKIKLFSSIFMLGFIFLLNISLVVMTVLAHSLSGDQWVLWESISLMINFFIFSLLLAIMFRLIPSYKRNLRNCIISGLCAALFFLFGKLLIGLYLEHYLSGSTYGVAGSIMVVLVWIYYNALTFLVSYEFSNMMLGSGRHGLSRGAYGDSNRSAARS